MGASISQVQPSQGNQPINPQPTQANYSPAQQQMGGKGSSFNQIAQPDNQSQQDYGQPQGKGGRRVIYSPLSDQPTMGQPNPYPNTIGQWDNASIQPQTRQMGKGKGG